MSYESSFADGERQAFKDRRNGIRRTPPADRTHPETRGFWDGYIPRGPAWAARSPQPAKAWWMERESETA